MAWMIALIQVSQLCGTETRQKFDIPAGPAEQTLAVFSRQSHQPVLFATDGLGGVRTKAIKGRYSDFEALLLLLDETEFTAYVDAESGALGIKPKSQVRIVELPPFVVEEKQTEPAWLYAKLDGVEVLSQCSELTTQLFVEHHIRLRQMLDVLIPAEFQAKLSEPSLYVLYNESNQPGIAREVLDSVERDAGRANTWQVRGLRNFRFWDGDSEATFAVLDERAFEQGKMSLTDDYIHYLLVMRTPTLPPWFVQGIAEVYQATVLETSPMANPPNYSWGRIGLSPVVLSPLGWVSEAETAEIKKHPHRKRELLPLEVMFATNPLLKAGAADPVLLQCQRALFVRWGLDSSDKTPARSAFWDFVRRACTEQVSEKMFQESFGLNYHEAEESLKQYLASAVKQTIYLSAETGHDPTKIDFKQASPGAVSRLKGRLERLEIAYVRSAFPDLTGKYVEQARRTIKRAWNNGDRDPRLQAELGLCECDAGDDAAAQPSLQAAAEAGVSRARVYYELARINYAGLKSKQTLDEDDLSALAKVLDLLRVAQTQTPPQPEAYELMMEIWLRHRVVLKPEQLAIVDEAVRLFRYRYRLVYSAALLDAQHSRVKEAEQLVTDALLTFADSAQQKKLQELQAAMARDFGSTSKE